MERASNIIRQARQMAGITQAELSDRTGVAQPSISAYERGSHDPTLQTLIRLVAGTGHRLDISLRDLATDRHLPTTQVGSLIRQRSRELVEAGKALGATNLRVFGSVARGEDGPQSDVDMLVDLEPGVSLIGLGELQDEFSRILSRKVDVVPASGLKPMLRDEVFAEAIPLE